MQKDEIADILKEIGVFLELKGENPFKTRAYQNGARTLEGLAEPLDALIAEERLGSIKGIGKALAEKITELATTGRLAYYDELKASIPDGLIAMLDIPGLGPKKVKAVHIKLGIETVEALEQACKESQTRRLPGFGKKTEAKILEGIEFRRNYASHHHISTALNLAEPILEQLRAHPESSAAAPPAASAATRKSSATSTSSFRRKTRSRSSTFSPAKPASSLFWPRANPKRPAFSSRAVSRPTWGRERSRVPVRAGLFHRQQGAQHRHGPARHRPRPAPQEYGLFRSAEETRDPKLRLDCKTEEEIFAALDLA
ncbi:MAG: hypothetical protein CM1200mP34_0510 [Verrucomicrobiales bacterium]|nr:MAG: hypothetical protein CM1200mP34_0510 [Verrucomicrobiales bacterium]